MSDIKILSEQEIKERLHQMPQHEKCELLRVLLAVQDVTAEMDKDNKQLVLSMWVNGILSYSRLIGLIG